MKARWKALEAKFVALQHREKVVVAAATLLGVLMIGYNVWVDPASSRAASLKKQIAKDKVDAQSLQAQLAGLTAQIKDPDAANRAALADVKRQTAAVDQELHEYDRILLPPERVQDLLRSLFARHRGLELVSLQTLPPVPLLDLPEAKAPGGKAADGKTPPAASAKGAGSPQARHRDQDIRELSRSARLCFRPRTCAAAAVLGQHVPGGHHLPEERADADRLYLERRFDMAGGLK